jgi:DNA repair exonuclease SbcCD ATPase subunit
MLNRIKLTNFRKHLDAEFNFGAGFTVIRGENEDGKSTIFEAMAYAMFGVKALRTPLDEAVTWGEPDKSLRVEIDLTVDGVLYNISRGKSGAEVNYAGGTVTGQTEVSNFVGQILRVDVNSAARLMVSNQKEIAGALEAGTKATTEMIERLAEFSQIDDLLDLMQEKLTLGSDSAAQAELSSAQERLDEARAVEEPDLATAKLTVEDRDLALAACATVLEANQSASDAAQTALATARAQVSERVSIEDRKLALQKRYTVAMTEMQRLKANPVKAIGDDENRVQVLLAQKADLAKQAETSKAYAAVAALCGKGDVERYDGSLDTLEQNFGVVQEKQRQLRTDISSEQVRIATMEGKLNSGNCTFCGKDFSELPEIKEKNSAIEFGIDEARGHIKLLEGKLSEREGALKLLGAFKAAAKPYSDAAARYGQYLTVDASVWPPILGWNGGVSVVGQDDLTAEQIDEQIRTVRAEVRAHANWEQALRDNSAELTAMEPIREEIEQREVALGPEPDIGAVREAANAAMDALNEARNVASYRRQDLAEARANVAELTRIWKQTQADVKRLSEFVEQRREAIKSLVFNNLLLKRVKAARPIIADRLWNLVLASVSGYFSEIRGVPSVVSKGKGGFSIDGKPVEAYSGSTIDSLGLAIRVALVRTFLPTAPFLILDEPAAACSEARTDNMLGFVVGCGFPQVLLVTHEDVSESVADHIITLGETV